VAILEVETGDGHRVCFLNAEFLADLLHPETGKEELGGVLLSDGKGTLEEFMQSPGSFLAVLHDAPDIPVGGILAFVEKQ